MAHKYVRYSFWKDCLKKMYLTKTFIMNSAKYRCTNELLVRVGNWRLK